MRTRALSSHGSAAWTLRCTHTMIKSDVHFAPPPVPSVVIELGLSSECSTMPSSYVAVLLTKLLPGFSSDATLDQVVQHVLDCGQVQALIDCSILDNCGLAHVLEEQYGITRFPPGRLPVKGVPCLQDWRVAALIWQERRRRRLEWGFSGWATCLRSGLRFAFTREGCHF